MSTCQDIHKGMIVISGHDFIQTGGDNPFNAVLECKVCGYVSRAGK